MRFGPVAFLLGTVGGWTLIRAVMLWPALSGSNSAERSVAWQPPLSVAATLAPTRVASASLTPDPSTPATAPKPVDRTKAPQARDREEAVQVTRSTPDAIAAVAALLQPQAGRLSLSGWAILRDGIGDKGLAAAGQLAGSQAGFRARYDLGGGLALAARVSAPLRSRRGKEAAVALDWRPVAVLPVTFTVERRVALDRGGRNAFAAGAFGGFDHVRLPLRFRLDGYAQAGAVGTRRRDLYIDGAVRAERRLLTRDGLSVGVGAGLWGGAQPGVTRVDIGPQIVARAPLGPASVRIGAEWRARAAGRARPGSGPVLSIGTSF